MFDNNEFNYNYDLDAVLLISKTREVLCHFSAREVDTRHFNAGFAGGGIASGGQNYTIATSENIKQAVKDKIDPKIIAYSCQVIVDGVEYKVLNVGDTNSRVGALNTFNDKKETILYLG